MRAVALALSEHEFPRTIAVWRDRMTDPAMANRVRNNDAEQVEPAAGSLAQAGPRRRY